MAPDSRSASSSTPQTNHWWNKAGLSLVIWLLVVALLWWVLSSVDLSNVWKVLGRLTALQIAALVAANVLIAFTFGWRWWLILRAQGYSIPYPIIASYQLVCYSISYFTPGPHFGGEPLQVYFLRQRHGVPLAAGTASVALAKLLEMTVNFTFLLIGVIITLQAQIAPGAFRGEAIVAAVFLLLLPLGFLAALYAGRRPIGSLLGHLPGRVRPPERWIGMIHKAEEDAGRACREYPGMIALAVAGSVVVWLGLFFEFWLSTHFLGLNLSWVQLVSIVTVARVALLLPSPGGLGTLEAGQVLMMQWLGLDPAAGLSLSLLIRARDILFGIIGLIWGAWLIGGWQFLWGREMSE